MHVLVCVFDVFIFICFFFFFSSRRRHTRFDCDWSSDVCSSDILAQQGRQCLLEIPGRDALEVEDRDQHVEALRSARIGRQDRSEEHTSELQSQSNLVCRLLLEKKKKKEQ